MSRRTTDREAQALSASPVFHRLIAEGRASLGRGVSADELDRRRPVAPIDREYAAAFGAALDLLEKAQGDEVTDEQGGVLKLILTAADAVRARAPLDQLAEDSGVDEATLRAAAAALEAAGLKVPVPAAKAG